MILSGNMIAEEVKMGNIVIKPFSKENINPNSYDFTLGDKLIVYKSKVLDAKKNNETEEIHIPAAGIVLRANRLYLGHTNEIMGSTKFVPIIRGRSSTGRLGIFVHITADLIDIGSINQYTLMLHPVRPVRVYPSMKIGQVTFWQIDGKYELYNGKYQGKTGPQPSQLYKDFI